MGAGLGQREWRTGGGGRGSRGGGRVKVAWVGVGWGGWGGGSDRSEHGTRGGKTKRRTKRGRREEEDENYKYLISWTSLL